MTTTAQGAGTRRAAYHDGEGLADVATDEPVLRWRVRRWRSGARAGQVRDLVTCSRDDLDPECEHEHVTGTTDEVRRWAGW